jgi:tRNA nucleotidyltransferase (CCA-adding enzyme)
MIIYLVGGAVRDACLGLPVVDRDYVVLGQTPERMLAAGFRPVGGDFPVFLHPVTHEEYALARTERKQGRGYAGFVFCADESVSLADDLARRDLTINAMAQDLATGTLIDYFGGLADLKAGILRHVSPAFGEDPVRVLRVARFAARYGFTVADETQTLMRQMGEAGELHYLVAERIWQECAKALIERTPTTFFEVLQKTRADALIFGQRGGEPRMYDAFMAAALPYLACAAKVLPSLNARFSVLTEGFDEATLRQFGLDFRVPKALIQDAWAWQTWRHYWMNETSDKIDAAKVLALFQALDIYRKPQQIEACIAWTKALQATDWPDPLPLAEQLRQMSSMQAAVLAVPVADVVAACHAADRTHEVAAAIAEARLSAIQALDRA